jgi:hypothetical protein
MRRLKETIANGIPLAKAAYFRNLPLDLALEQNE